jgi:hypothetical protein
MHAIFFKFPFNVIPALEFFWEFFFLQDEISGEYQTDIINHSEVLEEEEEEEEDDEEETSIAMEIAAGEATPMSIPSSNENSVGSPDEDRKPVVEVFDLPESSSEDVSPDMESHAMFIKLKEVGTSVQTGNQLNNSQFTILYRDKEKLIKQALVSL